MEVADKISAALSAMLANKKINDLELPEAYKDIEEKLYMLNNYQGELDKFVRSLLAGDIDADPPSKTNFLAGYLKQLQSQMRHLTWQSQCVAMGDYNQQVDFMGKFSKAFNTMVSQLKNRQEKIETQQAFMARLFDKLEPIFVVAAGKRDEFLYKNYNADVIINKKDSTFIKKLADLNPSVSSHVIQNDENSKWYEVMLERLSWSKEDDALLFYCVDISAHKRREMTLEASANTDAMSGLHNRRTLDYMLDDLWEKCAASKKCLSALMFDIDYFKKVNDTYGHQQGDACIKEFSKIIQGNALRDNDFIVRYGGEEFLVLLPFTNLENATKIAERIREATQSTKIALLPPKEGFINITVSCGVCSVTPTQNHNPKQIITAADSALYDAKGSGRNRVCARDIDNIKK